VFYLKTKIESVLETYYSLNSKFQKHVQWVRLKEKAVADGPSEDVKFYGTVAY
jgi:hypothetical protein